MRISLSLLLLSWVLDADLLREDGGTYDLLSDIHRKIQNVSVTYIDLESFTDDE